MNAYPSLARRYAPALSRPYRYLVRMAVFLVLAGFVVLVLYEAIWRAFLANPALNGIIGGVLLIGVLLSVHQVTRLLREVRWVNGGHTVAAEDPPVLLAPMAAAFGGHPDQTAISSVSVRSVLDSVSIRLDEGREIGRYITGLLVFLGLLGTFWGLLETVGSIGTVISSLRTGGEAASSFEDLKAGLSAPLAGMSISFSSSLFGLAGSLIVGFLDLQAGQAHGRFYTQLEDWLSARVSTGEGDGRSSSALIAALERLSLNLEDRALGEDTQATGRLADSVQGLVRQMRTEQQLLRDWVEAQTVKDADVRRLLENISTDRTRTRF